MRKDSGSQNIYWVSFLKSDRFSWVCLYTEAISTCHLHESMLKRRLERQQNIFCKVHIFFWRYLKGRQYNFMLPSNILIYFGFLSSSLDYDLPEHKVWILSLDSQRLSLLVWTSLMLYSGLGKHIPSSWSTQKQKSLG